MALVPLTRSIGSAERAMRALLERELARERLSFAQWTALVLIGTEPAFVDRLVERQLAGRVVAGEEESRNAVADLVARGLLTSAADGRLQQSDTGREVFRRLSTAVEEITRALYGDLPQEDLEATHRSLVEIAARADRLLAANLTHTPSFEAHRLAEPEFQQSAEGGAAGVDEPVVVVESRPEWPALFAVEADALRRVLEVSAVEHIGSTAVAGLAAKPVIDIQIGVAGPPDAGVVGGPLAALGYEGLGEAGVPGRLYFRRRGTVAYNVHVVELGGRHWCANLAVRDYLRAHPFEAAEYAAQKRRALSAGAATLLAYSNHKAAFVADLVRRALAWAAGCAPAEEEL